MRLTFDELRNLYQANKDNYEQFKTLYLDANEDQEATMSFYSWLDAYIKYTLDYCMREYSAAIEDVKRTGLTVEELKSSLITMASVIADAGRWIDGVELEEDEPANGEQSEPNGLESGDGEQSEQDAIELEEDKPANGEQEVDDGNSNDTSGNDEESDNTDR